MKRNFMITKLAVFMVALVLTLAVTAVALAKGADEWKRRKAFTFGNRAPNTVTVFSL